MNKSTRGKIVLSNKKLFLLFVKLERARRLADFLYVQKCVHEIEQYTHSIHQQSLAVFAYMYLELGSAKKSEIDEEMEDGRLRKLKFIPTASPMKKLS